MLADDAWNVYNFIFTKAVLATTWWKVFPQSYQLYGAYLWLHWFYQQIRFPRAIIKYMSNLSISVTLVAEMVLNCKNIEKLYMCNLETLESINIGLVIKVSSMA